jgi:hypothetical protein
MCEQATPDEREVRSARKRPAVELPKATEDDKGAGTPETLKPPPVAFAARDFQSKRYWNLWGGASPFAGRETPGMRVWTSLP